MKLLPSGKTVKKILLTVLSAGFFILSFPDYDYSLFAWFFLIPLFTITEGESPLKSFYISWFSFLIAFSGTVYWVVNSMYNYGGIPVYLSVFFLLLLSAYLALFPGCFFMLYKIICAKTSLTAGLAISPFLWVSLEYLRGHILTGFPWAIAGYSQWKMLPLIQVCDITGVYGISFLLVIFNASLYRAFFALKDDDKKGGSGFFGRFSLLLISVFLLCVFLIYGKTRINDMGKITSTGKPLNVGVVQGNIEQDIKWDDDGIVSSIGKHISLTDRVVGQCSPDIVLWPETALPFFPERRKTYADIVKTFVKEKDISLLSGGLGITENNGKELMFNSVFLFNPEINMQRYDKIHLVPFGEYIPFEKLLRISLFDEIIGDIGSFDSGEDIKVFNTRKGKFSVVICYEIIFPDLVRRFASSGAGVLFNVTNDAWFGKSSAPLQHFSNTVFRAIENRRFIVRSANSGISGVTAPDGSIVKMTNIFREDSFCAKVLLTDEKTFYSSYGDVFAYLSLLVTFLFISSLILIRRETK